MEHAVGSHMTYILSKNTQNYTEPFSLVPDVQSTY